MTLFYRALLFLGFTLLPFSLSSQNIKPANTPAKGDDIFEAIHLERQLFEISEEMQELLSQNPFGLSQSLNKQMLEHYKKAFTKQFLLTDAHRTFQDQLNTQYSDSTLQWINQETSQRILSAEEDYYTLQGIRKRVVRRYELEKTPPSQERITLVNTLAKKMGVREVKLKSKIILMRTFLKAFNALSKRRTFKQNQREAIIANYKNQLRTNMDKEVQTQFLVTYYGIKNEKLSTFSSFYNTDAGEWLRNTKSAALYSAYQAAADRFLESIQND
ncbi:hypothetical protein [Fodinibius halophilus]|uniref:DUF2059 domain-containing protein n=1 Tax=Fodinibius halophilus TaxID=1736908 RepID=A0A6M1T5G7_9BACT|nr:hypothetical protein [Fodinibius halophilus]NGP88515.1 hypothetical protein [Fodinibius halophilus]